MGEFAVKAESLLQWHSFLRRRWFFLGVIRKKERPPIIRIDGL